MFFYELLNSKWIETIISFTIHNNILVWNVAQFTFNVMTKSYMVKYEY